MANERKDWHHEETSAAWGTGYNTVSGKEKRAEYSCVFHSEVGVENPFGFSATETGLSSHHTLIPTPFVNNNRRAKSRIAGFMAQGALKKPRSALSSSRKQVDPHISDFRRSWHSRPTVLGPKKGKRVIAPKKAALVKHQRITKVCMCAFVL